MFAKKYLLTLFLSVFLMIGAFWCGYFISGQLYKNPAVLSNDINNNVIENNSGGVLFQSPTPQPTQLNDSQKASFLLKENDNKLVLYRVEPNGDIKEIKSFNVPLKMLPAKDREQLIKGIVIETQQEALEMIESYVS